jgi:hypothetical protein
MERNFLFITVISVLLLVATVSAFGQAGPLDGNWALEKASVLNISGNDTISQTINTSEALPSYFMFAHLAFKGDSIRFPNWLIEGFHPVTRKENKIEIRFMPFPYFLEYEREGEWLYLKQQIQQGDRLAYQVLITYKKEYETDSAK